MLRTLDCKKKTSTSPNRREKPPVRKTGKRRETEGQKEREREREGGMEDAVLYEKAG